MLHKETVSKEMWELLQKLMKEERLKDFTLVGGTALSLMLGHRLSMILICLQLNRLMRNLS